MLVEKVGVHHGSSKVRVPHRFLDECWALPFREPSGDPSVPQVVLSEIRREPCALRGGGERPVKTLEAMARHGTALGHRVVEHPRRPLPVVGSEPESGCMVP